MNQKIIRYSIIVLFIASLFAVMSFHSVAAYHTVTGYVVDAGNNPSVDKVSKPQLPTRAALIAAGRSSQDPLVEEKKAYVAECLAVNSNLGVRPAYVKKFCECLFENDGKEYVCVSYLFGKKPVSDQNKGTETTGSTETGSSGTDTTGATDVAGKLKIIPGLTTKKKLTGDVSIKAPSVGKAGVRTAAGTKTGASNGDSGSKGPQPGQPTGKLCDEPTDCGAGQVCDKAAGMCVWSDVSDVGGIGGGDLGTTPAQPSCVDSDNSKSITQDPSWMVKGYAKDTTYNVNKEDTCETLNNVEYLMEGTCYNNLATYSQINCPVDLGKDYTCSQGVCAKVQPGTTGVGGKLKVIPGLTTGTGAKVSADASIKAPSVGKAGVRIGTAAKTGAVRGDTGSKDLPTGKPTGVPCSRPTDCPAGQACDKAAGMCVTVSPTHEPSDDESDDSSDKGATGGETALPNLPTGIPNLQEQLELQLSKLVFPDVPALPADSTAGKKDGDIRKTPDSTPGKKEFIKQCMARNDLKVPPGLLRNFCGCLFDNNKNVTLCKRLLKVGKEGERKTEEVGSAKKGLPAYDTGKKKPADGREPTTESKGTTVKADPNIRATSVIPRLSLNNVASLLTKVALPELPLSPSSDSTKAGESTKDKEAKKTKYVKECLVKNDKLLADKAKLRGFCACLYDNRGDTTKCKHYLAARPGKDASKDSSGQTVRPKPKLLPAFDVNKLPPAVRKNLETHRNKWFKQGTNSRNKSDKSAENSCIDRLKKNKKLTMQFNDKQIQRACDCLAKGKPASQCFEKLTDKKIQSPEVKAEAEKELVEAEKEVDQQEQQAENSFVNGCVAGVKGIKEFADFSDVSVTNYCSCLFDQGKECLALLETKAPVAEPVPETTPEQEPEGTQMAPSEPVPDEPVQPVKQCPLLSQVCDYYINSKDMVSLYPGAETELYNQGSSLKMKFVNFGDDGKSCVTQFAVCDAEGICSDQPLNTLETGAHINYMSIDIKMQGAFCLE